MLPDPLRRDVRMLTTMLGRAIAEHGGPELLAQVERLRRACIARREEPSERRRRQVERIVASFDPPTAERVTRAFTAYFQLVNLAEEHHRVRALREAGRSGRALPDSIEAAVRALGAQAVRERLAELRVHPVLTAHPTEAKRRAVVEFLWRIGALLEELDDPRRSRAEAEHLRRRLAEEISGLWLTAPVRRARPTPLDEVRATLALFDQTIFRVAPLTLRELERCLDPDGSGARPTEVPAFLRWGTWVGGDRDGNPNVTADVTRATVRIQADHVLRGLERAARRIARSLTAAEEDVHPSPALRRRLAAAEEALPRRGAELRRVLPDAPHRRALVLVAERLAATRADLDRARPSAPAYTGPDELLRDLRTIRDSLDAGGAARLAHGELQHLVWQAETFGFHLAEIEVRQHASVHAAAIEELAPGASADARRLDRIARGAETVEARPRSDVAREVLDTFRAIGEIQDRFGRDACRRVIVSFTRSAADLAAVHALARLARPERPPLVDAIPLLESSRELERATQILEEAIALPVLRRALRRHQGRLEVMLGYSDSAKEIGVLGANLLLYRTQRELTRWARTRGLVLTLFHGRGGALGRGGGPTNRAILGQPPGSVDGRFKVTEQGEAAFQRYGNRAVALRHLEQVTNAVLLAPGHGAPDPAEPFAPSIATMERASIEAYRALLDDPRFAECVRRATPLRAIGELPIASRPVSRDASGGLAAIRAIPWVFAWAQSRVNLTGWYGLGRGLEAVAGQPGGLASLRTMYRRWPFFAAFLENAELSLAKADRAIAELYLARAGAPELAATILEEFDRTEQLVLAVTGRDRVLAGRPALRAAIDLRNPYVDALSFLQLRFLDDGSARGRRIVHATISGVAAGLQNTG